MPPRYEHQQIDPKGVFGFAVLFGVVAAIAWFVWGPVVSMPVFSIGGLYLLIARAPFMSLLTELDATSLTVQFWLGIPRRQIPTDHITGARAVTNPKWASRGGVHRIWSDGLWSYSVWGVEAVEVRFRDEQQGEAALRIGTDDVEGLLTALAEHGRR
jgi:hypothetical protein